MQYRGQFGRWGGAASGSANPTSITMDAPHSVTATFSVPGFTCDINSDDRTDVLDVQLGVAEALGTAQSRHDLTHDQLVTVADIQKMVNAVLGVGCVY